MPHTSSSPQLSYIAEGKGPLVIMLHGLLMDGKSWRNNGFTSLFSPFFHVICPDLLGHGESEKPLVPELYTQKKQALSIVKIMDELGYEKAHVIGYSSGAWAALGLLNHHPERLNSVILGGWDLKNGLPETPDGKLTFDMFMSYARSTAPELTSGLTPDDQQSVRCFFNELRKYSEKNSALFPYKTPILLWAGANDPYYAPMAKIAEQYGLLMTLGKGDHLTEFNKPDKSSINEIFKFIESQEGSISSVTCS
ncbi:alpha/beta hydrolase [Enterobacter kobei]|uniref:alpha/beta fold hydrolase n=1 Tax=Enterobacter kobei TaxID=208224 RepID=UPI0028D583D5|nr:alpha/beta hydrolase [Enterobacter kobei]WNP36112.1 alpha/beta hydrolase [Enterobacter kobei]